MGTTVTETTTTVTGLTPGTQYRFRVRAKNAVGFGPFSQWSTPGTPTGGTTTPPAPALQVSLSLTPATGTTGGIASSVTAAASADGATLANVVYTWQGRFLRTISPALCIGPACRFTTPASSSWETITLATGSILQNPGFHRAGPTPNVLWNIYYWQGYGGSPVHANVVFPSNYWEVRCRVTATRIVDGVPSGTSEGFSRAVPFKEYFIATYDYPTDLT
jgi:hypothetical protein